jgi:hypothetical protein
VHLLCHEPKLSSFPPPSPPSIELVEQQISANWYLSQY